MSITNRLPWLGILILVAVAAGPVAAGGPKPSHPCYGVADCKNEGSQKEFSACIKANKAEADANTDCATFRNDKEGWMKANGVADLSELFES
jgi:hypothetical protein